MRSSIALRFVLAAGAAALLAGCHSAPPSAGRPGGPAKRNSVKVGFLVKQPEEQWFQNEWTFARKCAADNHFDVVTLGATNEEQVLTQIDNLGSQGAQGFVICTPNPKLGPAIVARAKANNLKVFSVDDQFVDADGKPLDVPYMGISAKDIGESCGKELADQYKKRGWTPQDTAAIGVTWDQLETAKERTDGARRTLTAAGFPADRIYSAPEKSTDVPGSLDAATIVLTQHPEVKHWLIFSMNDEGVLGAVRAAEGRGFGPDNVVGVGIGGTNTALSEFQKPKPTGFFATSLISPKRHGYETTEYMYHWIKDGKEPPKDTRTVGIMVTRETCEKVMREQGLL